LAWKKKVVFIARPVLGVAKSEPPVGAAFNRIVTVVASGEAPVLVGYVNPNV